MKAKTYADRFRDAEEKDIEMREIAKEFVFEIKSLSWKRGIKTDEGFLAVLRELNQKYKAYCRIVNGRSPQPVLNPGGVRFIMLDMIKKDQDFLRLEPQINNALGG